MAKALQNFISPAVLLTALLSVPFSLEARAPQSKPTDIRKSRALNLIDGVISALGNTAKHRHRVEIGDNGKPVAGAASFQTSNCDQISSEEWLALLFSNKPIKHIFKFKKGCDINGVVTLTKKIAPVDLDVRNLEGLSHVKAHVEADSKMIWSKKLLAVTLNANRAELTRKSATVMEFNAIYEVGIGLSGRVEKNLGGTVFVKSFEGKPLKFDHDFLIQ